MIIKLKSINFKWSDDRIIINLDLDFKLKPNLTDTECELIEKKVQDIIGSTIDSNVKDLDFATYNKLKSFLRDRLG